MTVLTDVGLGGIGLTETWLTTRQPGCGPRQARLWHDAHRLKQKVL